MSLEGTPLKPEMTWRHSEQGHTTSGDMVPIAGVSWRRRMKKSFEIGLIKK